ncbi:pectin lyase-like protein [Imleria badia]|nr:pectin lyase-like protein [Imleria badia]
MTQLSRRSNWGVIGITHIKTLVLTVVSSVAYATTTWNVLNYGGAADNATDIAPAITKAYTDCGRGSTMTNPADTVLYVPPGTYALETYVTFEHADNFTIEIDGESHLAFNPSLRGNMPNRPRLLRFDYCNNVDISGVTLYNAPTLYVTIMGDNNVAHNMTIIADHIGETNEFDNGDECVTVKAPTDGFVAENIQCLNSAGIVRDVYYRNVTQLGEDGGIVLKSYPTASGIVKNATYVESWTPSQDVSFQGISGTGDSTDRPTIECADIVFQDVNITKEGGAAPRVSISNTCSGQFMHSGSGLSNISAC